MTNPRTFWVKLTSKCLGNNYKYKDIIISIAELKRYESSYYPIWSPENIIVEFEYTKEVIRIRKSKNKQHNGQKFEEAKEVIRICKSKDRQHNDQKFEDTKG